MTSVLPLETVQVGPLRIDAVLDADLRIPVGRLWAGGPAPFARETADQRFPDEFTAGDWRFRVRVFLVRSPEATVLIDAGMGPAEVPMGREFGFGGSLLDTLRSLQIAPDRVDHVVLTHRHDDHVGWGAAFPSAHVHLGADDIEAAVVPQPNESPTAGLYRAAVFGPVSDSGLLRPITGSRTLIEGVRLEPSPGHTPGHTHVVVEHEDRCVAILGDLVHLQFQLTHPGVAGPFDAEPDRAAEARIRALDALPPGALLATAHLPDAFTSLPTDRTMHKELPPCL